VPILKKLSKEYYNNGLRIFAFHRPEFSFEKNPLNILHFLLRENIDYMVALDNFDQAWNDWKVEFWPQQFLILPTPRGGFRLIHTHFGDRNHHEMEQFITNFLGIKRIIEPYNHELWNDMEFFLGRSHRWKNISHESSCDSGACKISLPTTVSLIDNDKEKMTLEYKKGITHGQINFLSSEWEISTEFIQSKIDNAMLDLDMKFLNLNGEKLSIYLVVEPPAVEDNGNDKFLQEGQLVENTSTNLMIINTLHPMANNIANIYKNHQFHSKRIWARIFDQSYEISISHTDRHFLGHIPLQSLKMDETHLKCTLTLEKGLKLYVIYLTTEPPSK
jgi:hypothetical protein